MNTSQTAPAPVATDLPALAPLAPAPKTAKTARKPLISEAAKKLAISKPATDPKKAAVVRAAVAAEGSARSAIPGDARIVLLVTTNPKRPGTKAARRFAAYGIGDDAKKAGIKKVATTVADFTANVLALKFPRRKAFSNLRWDAAHGFVAIEGLTPDFAKVVKAAAKAVTK